VTSTTEGQSYPVHHRGPSREDATETTLLDENAEAADHEYFDLGAFDVSMDHRFAAWSMDTAGDERYTLRIRDLTTGQDLADRLDEISNAGVAWSRDGNWIFYVTPDAQERPSTVWRHRIGTPQADDVCVFDETDERFYVNIGSTRSDAWIVIHSASRTSADARLIATDRPTDDPTVVLARREDVEYGIDHWGDSFVMHTNDDAVDFRLLVADGDAATSNPEAWTELVGPAGVLMPPGFDHCTINPGPEPLLFSDVIARGVSGIYDRFVATRGAAYLEVAEGALPHFVPNPTYRRVPPLTRVELRDYPHLGLTSQVPLYTAFIESRGQQWSFLTDPTLFYPTFPDLRAIFDAA